MEQLTPPREQCHLNGCAEPFTLQYSHMIGPRRYLYCSSEHQQEALAKNSKSSAAYKDLAHV